ncbi:restriction endonuclease subunit S [Saccharomonospora xinjiangensis]|uniref:restriction endonuclease subunit S n=1 Tax=Saccharomonospora xinjiangensis TaxID=75294 RepID=UPI00106F0D95|nr:restriction endonuclease subunit S [Saccharomonospora xinjiangensis]QBQ59886.1 Type-1 restriction enzyme EcoKI specificity protein [Saccharomonospora xinjiangensis]
MSIQEELSAAPAVPLRYLVSFNPRPTSDFGGDVVYLPMEAISEFGPVDTSRRRPFGELRQGYSYVENGDIALAKVTPCFENGKGLVARNLPDGHAFATTEVTVIRPSAKIDADYLGWILQSSHFVKQGESHMTGSGGLRRVPESFIGSYSIPLPDRRTQRAIADYLDRETARIDTLIEEQQRLIEMLRERRSAGIAACLESLGGMTRLKHVSTVQTGVTLSGEGDSAAPEWPYLRVANVQVGYVDLRDVKTVRVPADRAAASMLQSGDVLMTEGGDIDKLGRGAIWRGEVPNMLHQNHIFAVRPSEALDSEFLVHWLDGPVARTYFRTTAKQTTNLAGTNKWTLGNLPVPVPPLDEQRRVVRALDQQTTKIDTLIAETERFIELARERRAALITAAVTGQIDVREMV